MRRASWFRTTPVPAALPRTVPAPALPMRPVRPGAAPTLLRATLLGLTALAGCTTGQPYDAAMPPAMLAAQAGPPPGARHVAILLPLSGPNAERGQALLRAAQLAFAPPGAPAVPTPPGAPGAPAAPAAGASPLDPRDTGGTPEGAAAAARAALAAGDAIILGPLTAGETAAVAPIAQSAQVAVLAFTNDTTQARPGVWTLGITPGQQVRRLYAAVRQDGRTRVEAVLPNSAFGSALADALAQASLDQPASITRYDDASGLDAALRDVSDYESRHNAQLQAQAAAAPPSTGTDPTAPAGADPAAVPAPAGAPPAGPGAGAAPAATTSATGSAGSPAAPASPGSPDSLAATIAGLKAGKPPAPPGPALPPLDPPPFDALLLAETGPGLRSVAGPLRTYGVAPPKVRLLGPALWADAHLSALAGAWYAAPDPAARAGFEAQYRAANGTAPLLLSDLAYDAAAIARVLGTRDLSAASLERPQGFAGVDGVLALLPDGRVRRGLAVFEIGRDGSSHIVQPAPHALGDSGV